MGFMIVYNILALAHEGLKEALPNCMLMIYTMLVTWVVVMLLKRSGLSRFN